MIFKIMITLSEIEATNLSRLALRETRSPREQILYLIRRELLQSGFLEPSIGDGSVRDITSKNP